MLKKLGCILLAMLLVIPGAMVFADGDVTCEGGIKFYKEYPQAESDTLYKEISTKETGNVCAGASVTNSSADEKDVMALMVLYADADMKRISSVAMKSQEIPAGETADVKTSSVKLNGNEVFKAYLWTDGMTPLATPSTLAEKTTRVYADFEDASHVIGSAPAANNSAPERLAPTEVVIANDPDPSGAHGKVAKFELTKGSKIQFNGFLNANVGISDMADYYGTSLEFDVYYPAGLKTTMYMNIHPVDGGGIMAHRYALADAAWPSAPGRFITLRYGSPYINVNTETFVQSEFYGSWHTIKIEFLPSSNGAMSEAAIYLDGKEMGRSIGVFGTEPKRPNRFTIGVEKQVSNGTDADGNPLTYCFYIDNVKISA